MCEGKALTLAVQHVAFGAQEEQEEEKRTPTDSPGRRGPRHLQPAPRCSLHTLRRRPREAKSRFHCGGGSLRPFSGFVLSVTHSCPVGKVGKGGGAETERA